MKATRETRAGLWALLAVQLLTSMTAIVLLSRMGPAIDQILRENVFSTVAVEDMLVSLSLDGGTDRFADALARAEGNITEDSERPLLAAIAKDSAAAQAGDPKARAAVVEALRSLAEVNRQSMVSANQAASRLGLGGAWAMALMGLAGFLGSVAVWRRIDQTLLQPTQDIARVLHAARAGDPFRRCHVATQGPGGRLGEDLNFLLDCRTSGATEPADGALPRVALVGLLDRLVQVPAVVGTRDGAVLTANLLALDRNVETNAIGRAVRAGTLPAGWSVVSLGDQVWLATWDSAPADEMDSAEASR